MIDVTTLNDIPARRVGIVKIARSRFPLTIGELDFKKQLFKLVTPICEYEDKAYYGQDVELWQCYCDKFRKVVDGEMLPTYEITVHREESGEVEIIKLQEVKND